MLLKTLEDFKPLVPIVTTNIKHSPAPSQIKKKNLLLKDHISQFLLPDTTYAAFNKLLQGNTKRKTNIVRRDKTIVKTILRYNTDVEIIRQGMQNNYD